MKLPEIEIENLFNTDIKNINIMRCGHGDINLCYKIEYGGYKYFLKIQKDKIPSLYEKQIEREIIAGELCRANKIPCPKVIDFSLEKNFIITEFLEYDLLGNIADSLSENDWLIIKKQVLSIIDRMSNIVSDSFGAIYEGGKIIKSSRWSDVYINYIKTALGDCINYGTLNKDEAEQILERAEINKEILCRNEHESAVLSHMDLHWNNIFIDKNDLSIKAIFDFGSSMFTPLYMNYFRLDWVFLYGSNLFFDELLDCPIEWSEAEDECAKIMNTLDYLTFLSFMDRDVSSEKKILLL